MWGRKEPPEESHGKQGNVQLSLGQCLLIKYNLCQSPFNLSLLHQLLCYEKGGKKKIPIPNLVPKLVNGSAPLVQPELPATQYPGANT